MRTFVYQKERSCRKRRNKMRRLADQNYRRCQKRERRVISPLRHRCLFLIFSLFSATGGENERSSFSTALDFYVLYESSPLSDESRFNLQSNLTSYKTEGKDSVHACPSLTPFKTYIPLKMGTYLVRFIVYGSVNFYTNLREKLNAVFLFSAMKTLLNSGT